MLELISDPKNKKMWNEDVRPVKYTKRAQER